MKNVTKLILTGLGILSSLGIYAIVKDNQTAKAVIETAAKTVEEPVKKWGGIELSELTKIAKSVNPEDFCKIDQWGFLVLHFKSNRGHQNFQTQFTLNDALELVDMQGAPVFEGQRWSEAVEFARRVKDLITFTEKN